MPKRLQFETSGELRKLFSRELDTWCRRNHLTLHDLSARCGVSPSYLAHIGRYGRIPSRPVLILLALNFGMENPDELLRAAGEAEHWPFDGQREVSTPKVREEGFLSVKLDMAGFVDAIKAVVRAESRPRSLRELLRDRPLRIGVNRTQPYFFGSDARGEVDLRSGLIPELCHLMGNSLSCSVALVPVEFCSHAEKLLNGEIDIYGPMLATPQGPSALLFSLPLNRVGISAIMRLGDTHGLKPVPIPSRFDQLRDTNYRIAVIRNSRAHLITNTRLNRPNETLVLCDTIEEGIDRVLTRGIPNPAHMLVTNSMNITRFVPRHTGTLMSLFDTPDSMIDISNNSFAIRPDWGEAVPAINDALSFILSAGGFSNKIREVMQAHGPGMFEAYSDTPRVINS